ncbi:MAG: hypothetical protein H6Q73_1223 [Firmicutes bacterium]|nr:hypothetical protein [Bacillota bacterium]
MGVKNMARFNNAVDINEFAHQLRWILQKTGNGSFAAGLEHWANCDYTSETEYLYKLRPILRAVLDNLYTGLDSVTREKTLSVIDQIDETLRNKLHQE